MDNKNFVKEDSLTIEDLWRQMCHQIILTPTGPMPPGDASTLQKVSELKVTAIVAGDLLCGLRFERPSGETGNMVAPSDLVTDAVIYQGNDAGIPAATQLPNQHPLLSSAIDDSGSFEDVRTSTKEPIDSSWGFIVSEDN